MKRSIILYTVISFFSTTLFAQPSPDSLRQVMNEGKSYKEKISAFLAFVSYYELKKFDTAIAEGHRAIELARENGDSAKVAEFNRHIGIASYFKGEYADAVRYFVQAITILENLDDKNALGYAYNDLAKLYRKTRDLDRALQYYDKAEALFRKTKNNGGLSMIMNESGVVFEYKGNYEEAIARYENSLQIAESSGDQLAISYAESNIAGVYVLQKRFKAAEARLLHALDIREKLNDSFAIALTYSDLGAALNANGDYSKAKTYLLQSNEVAIQLRYTELQSNNYNELASIAEKQGDFGEALKYFKLKTSLRDSLFALEKTRLIEETNARYNMVKREQKIEQQHNRIRLQYFIFIGVAGLILLIGLLLHSQYRRYRLAQQTRLKTALLKQRELLVKAVMEAEENERQRIARDLHDGVGQMMSAAKMNLSAFESRANINDAEQKKSLEKIIGLIDDSCKEVRTVSHIMMPNTVLKNSLGDAVREFVNKLDSKTLEVRVDDEGSHEKKDAHKEIIIYRVIQEAVNNVIKHACATKLDISLIRDPGGISVTIEDNGKGFDTLAIADNDGIGLKNIFSRIKYLGGTWDIDSAPGRGTVIAIHVPL